MSFKPRPYPSYVQTDTEKIYWDKSEMQNEVIRCMQKKLDRNPIRSFFWRKPWKAPDVMKYIFSGDTLLIKIQSFWSWLTEAHDCSDPAVGCSCSGSFRYSYNDS